MSTISKLGCITNFDMLFLVMGFTWLMKLISSRQICIRSINHVVIRLHFWGNLVPRALRMGRPELLLKERKSVRSPTILYDRKVDVGGKEGIERKWRFNMASPRTRRVLKEIKPKDDNNVSITF